MQRLYRLINKNIQTVPISLANSSSISQIPILPGWYFIETDTPINILSSLGPPIDPKCTFDIPARIQANSILTSVTIRQKGNLPYIIYSGHHSDVHGRCREHLFSPKGTMNLSQYHTLHTFNWNVWYSCPTQNRSFNPADKRIRTAGEQVWRAFNGWPILSLEWEGDTAYLSKMFRNLAPAKKRLPKKIFDRKLSRRSQIIRLYLFVRYIKMVGFIWTTETFDIHEALPYWDVDG